MITDNTTNNIPAQEQESTATEAVSDNNIETEINDTAKIAEEENGTAVSENTNAKEEDTAATEQEPEDVTEARSRALAQIERMSREKGFSGPWGNLFREYPTLSRADAVKDLALRSSSTATGRAIGDVAENNKEQELDDFLIGFYSV